MQTSPAPPPALPSAALSPTAVFFADGRFLRLVVADGRFLLHL
jgi:hypothetical protein